MIAIEMVGSVYSSLSPRDPQHRLHSLVQQTQTRLVLIHHLTKTIFNVDIITLDIDSVLNDNELKSNANVDRLSSITVTDISIAYITLTSGSTGVPKAVRLRHFHKDLL